MLHAAASFIGLLALWLLLTHRWSTPQDLALAAGVAAACVLVGMRFGGLGRGGGFMRAPRLLLLALGRIGAVMTGAMATIRAAVAADVALKPALVRGKLRPSSDFARAALAHMISAAPGGLVVEADADSLLVHVLNEDALDAAELGQFEMRAAKALDGAPR